MTKDEIKTKIKNILTKIKNVFITVFSGIGVIFTSIFAIKIISGTAKKNDDIKEKEDIENEIKNTPASDVVADSPNQDDVSSAISNEQSDFRKRVRDRLNQNLQRN